MAILERFTSVFQLKCHMSHGYNIEQYIKFSFHNTPTSLLPAESKILKKIAHHKLVAFFADHPDIAALPLEQFAYRSHHNCEDEVSLAIDKWNRALENDECCGVVFCDMFKVFDRVKYTLLMEKLASVG